MECFNCKLRFPSIAELVSHTRKCAALTGFRCSFCLLLYNDIYGWRRHLIRKHPQQIESCVPRSPCASLVSPLRDSNAFSGCQSPGRLLTPHKGSPSTSGPSSAKRRILSCDENVVQPIPGTSSQSDGVPVTPPTRFSTVPEGGASNVVFGCNQVPAVGMPNASSDEYLKNIFARVFSLLHKDTGTTSSLVQQVAESIEFILNDGIENCLDLLVAQNLRVNDEVCSHLIEGFEHLKVVMRKSFRPFKTIHLREQYFSNLGTFVKPRTKILGPALVSIGRKPMQMTTSTAQLIPMKKMLQRILSIPGLMDEMDLYIQQCCDNVDLVNIINSPCWIETFMSLPPLKDAKTYPILLYFDEFETGNPLGSHAGIHKLGGVYISIPCLPPRLSSQLSFIFLAYLFHSSDRITFGNFITFAPVIKEINELATEGVTVSVGSFQGTVRFAVAAIVGDNLGLHGMLGFVESFGGNYPCRICRASKELCRGMLVEEQGLLRDGDNYLKDVEANDVKNTGVKGAPYAGSNFSVAGSISPQ